MTSQSNFSENYFSTWSSQKNANALEVSSVSGFELELLDGRRVIDGLSTAYNTSFGYSAQGIKDRIHQTVEEYPAALAKWHLPLREEQSQRLKALLGQEDGKIFYTVSGLSLIHI